MPSEEPLLTSVCTSCPLGLKNSTDAGWFSGSGLSDVTMKVRKMSSPGRHTPRSPNRKPFVPLGLVVPPTSKLLSDSAAPRSTLTKASCPSASAATMEGSSLHFSTARPSESVDASATVWFCLS